MANQCARGADVKLELRRIPAQHNVITVLRYVPRRPRGVTIVAAHGYSSSKQNLDPLCAFLAGHGFEIFNFDFPGHKLGASGGVLRNFDDCLDAMAAVVSSARAHAASQYVLGHSLGALTALVSAAGDASLHGVVAIATGYRRAAAFAALQANFSTDLRSAYVDGATLPELFEGVDARIDGALPLLAGRPALYVAAKHDAMVPASSVAELYDRAPEPKRLVEIESNHTSAGENSRTEVLRWLNELHPRESQ
jgi:alpha-beta hydrolase superfamily lysophospholipase